MKIRFERFLRVPGFQLSGSAGFQPAVSPISNRQTVRQPRAALGFWGVRRLEALRYRRLETCGTAILSTAVLLAILSANAATNDLTGIMQKALFEEEGNHNLPAAIEAYQNIISRFDEARATTATAIFRLGECYRKQGKTNEAVAQYQRVIREFRDQSTLATLSEQNLGSLGAPASSGSAFSDRLRGLIREAQTGSHDTNNLPVETESAEIKRIQAMIKESPDLINAKETGSGTTPLHRAAQNGQLSVVEFLLSHGADIDPKDMAYGGQTPLHYAVEAGHKAVAEVLLNKGASINATDGSGSTPLHLAADRGFRTVVELLLAHGADVNAKKLGGVTPLHLAVANGNRSIVELMLG